ncbi:MAG: Sensor histidine kinase, partial [Parcubacteria group bacterium GW2011_GWF2_44_8]
KNEQSKIFNRFYRASNVKNNSSSGSGLGLYIVRSIVEQLHGSISFESEENSGTTFFVSLPISE